MFEVFIDVVCGRACVMWRGGGGGGVGGETLILLPIENHSNWS